MAAVSCFSVGKDSLLKVTHAQIEEGIRAGDQVRLLLDAQDVDESFEYLRIQGSKGKGLASALPNIEHELSVTNHKTQKLEQDLITTKQGLERELGRVFGEYKRVSGELGSANRTIANMNGKINSLQCQLHGADEDRTTTKRMMAALGLAATETLADVKAELASVQEELGRVRGELDVALKKIAALEMERSDRTKLENAVHELQVANVRDEGEMKNVVAEEMKKAVSEEMKLVAEGMKEETKKLVAEGMKEEMKKLVVEGMEGMMEAMKKLVEEGMEEQMKNLGTGKSA